MAARSHAIAPISFAPHRIATVTTIPEARPGGSRRWSQGRWGQSRWNPLQWDPEALAQLSPASTLRYTFTLYLVSRLLFLLIAGIDAAAYGTSLGSALSNWDGYWYLQTSEHWYLHHVFHHPGQYSTLGFMPLYPMAMWLVAHVTQIGELGAGLAISLIAGFVATVQIGKLAPSGGASRPRDGRSCSGASSPAPWSSRWSTPRR